MPDHRRNHHHKQVPTVHHGKALIVHCKVYHRVSVSAQSLKGTIYTKGNNHLSLNQPFSSNFIIPKYNCMTTLTVVSSFSLSIFPL